MAELPPVAGVIKIQLGFTNGGHTGGNRFYMGYTGTPPARGWASGLAFAVRTAWTADLAPLTVASTELGLVTVQDLSDASGDYYEDRSLTPGVRPGAPVTAETCAIIGHFIIRKYRGGRPRTYLNCGSNVDIANTTEWNPGFPGSVQSGWNNFIGAISSHAGGPPLTGQVNVSYYKGFSSVQDPITKRWKNVPTLRPVPLVDPIVGHSVNLRLGSQRRRLYD